MAGFSTLDDAAFWAAESGSADTTNSPISMMLGRWFSSHLSTRAADVVCPSKPWPASLPIRPMPLAITYDVKSTLVASSIKKLVGLATGLPCVLTIRP